ncbi:hypothetical protein [Natronosalvus amylolyticus]|uniref:hypothetical protein n=1 Tax=Natronosalvus amylolyticus TaxID=2961994 RepID=UPI0020C9CC55|nr:hypothetical protein [Natronosalvus amylolyticus]
MEVKTIEQPLFNATTVETTDLKRLLKLYKSVTPKAPMTVSENGLQFLAADPSMVGMIDLRLKTDLFDGYEYPEEPVTFGVNIEKLEECVREARKGDTVTSSAVRERCEVREDRAACCGE